MKKAQLLAALKRLSPLASAPFEELALRDALQDALGELGLHFQTDAFGNTIVRVRRGLPRSKVGFVVHLDPPVMRVVSVKGTQVTLEPQGPIPTTGLTNAAVTFTESQRTGKIATIKQTKNPARVTSLVVKLTGKGDAPAVGSAALFDLPAFEAKAQHVKMRQGFVVASAVCVLDALVTLARQDAACEAWGVFLRAEQVGALGAVAMMVSGLLPRDLTLVALSAASTDVKALGAGPAVRVGDAQGPFDPRATSLALGAARALAKDGKARTLYDDTEKSSAATFVAFGYKTTSIALPVANLHSQAPKGIAAEQLDVLDLDATSKLLIAIAERAGTGVDDLDLVRNDLVRHAEEGQKRLRTPHAGSDFAPDLS